jgi:hypothetical protein
MYRTFNMGVGMILIVSPRDADDVMLRLKGLKETADVIGHIETRGKGVEPVVTLMIRIGVLASGSGSNLQAIMDACAGGLIEGTVAVVVCNVEGAYALERGPKDGCAVRSGPAREVPGQDAFDAELARILEDERVDLVALAGSCGCSRPPS